MAKKSLIVVESPTKVRTISKFLGPEYVIKASVGHIKDLPSKELGVDVENGFAPKYITIRGKGKVLAEIKKAAVKADNIYLAPDPDREGEAICWHLLQELNKQKAKVSRLFFNEITKSAVLEALQHPTQINQSLVKAQQARRILDRLVGYKLSPLLWRKVQRGLSAGRVQSVAVRLICDREEEITAFEPREYWSITAQLEGSNPPPFEAKLVKIKTEKINLSNEQQTNDVLKLLKGQTYQITKIQTKPKKRFPVPPFTTSKLQQEAARKLGFSAKKTMLLAQQLYEGVDLGQGEVGLITYMRTDSTRISQEAQQETRQYITQAFGKEYLPATPPVYKSQKGTQDAHEAIRPSSTKRTPASLKAVLSHDHFRLYELIWQRLVASQMNPALMDTTQIDIQAGPCLFRASGSVLIFPGFMRLYIEGKDEETGAEEEKNLPSLKEKEVLSLLKLTPAQHFTQPPPRYTEATLVKELEEKGIGRPSTYATILATIQNRQYVEKQRKRFFPTPLGIIVNKLLVAHFPHIMDVKFTAQMEGELDKIGEGQAEWVQTLQNFYNPFAANLEKAENGINLRQEVKETDLNCDKCGAKLVIRWGRNGEFLACSAYPECKNTMNFTTDEKGKITIQEEQATEVSCKTCGQPMLLKNGRFGHFFACSGYPECKTTYPAHQDGNGQWQPIEEKEQATAEKCPKCGQPMVIKQGRFGRFMSCSDYPQCKHIQGMPTGVACPQQNCKGELVEKKSQRGKIFYSCDQYPDCKFALWDKPIPKACPQCKALFLVQRYRKGKGNYLACYQSECGYEEEL